MDKIIESGDKTVIPKGQIISECPYKIIVWTKIPTLPQPLRRGQIKKIKALYYTNQGLFNIIGLINFLI